jgi:osmoprotectant transport system permease protein
MSLFADTLDYLSTAANWRGRSGIGHRLIEHVQYSALSVAIAAVIALPIGVAIGHRVGRRGSAGWLGRLAVLSSSSARALPTFGLMVLVIQQWPGRVLSLWPVVVVLVVLAIPPMLANAVVGVSEVSPGVRDAARGMGLTERQVLTNVELPLASSLLLSGVRSSTLQVVATLPIAAYSGQGTLGRLLIDGLATRNFTVAAAGSVMIVVVALVCELAFMTVGRMTRRTSRR